MGGLSLSLSLLLSSRGFYHHRPARRVNAMRNFRETISANAQRMHCMEGSQSGGGCTGESAAKDAILIVVQPG